MIAVHRGSARSAILKLSCDTAEAYSYHLLDLADADPADQVDNMIAARKMIYALWGWVCG